ncbi:MAG: RES family NAD+ phosphorylase [Spirochaetales bacterium]|nr:RES family NAD+ phosphorylase [Spirochaetales bacterium]
MDVYRIAKKAFVNDLSGEGARLYGGRWNKKGTSLLYTAENRSLATVEYLVHIPLSIVPNDIYIASINLPEKIRIHTVEENELPSNWTEYPSPFQLSQIIEKLIEEKNPLAIRVPSVIVRGEWNILVNPTHQDFNQIKITNIRECFFDKRLLRK